MAVKSLVLENTSLLNLARKSDAVAQFSFLLPISQLAGRRGCGCSGGAKNKDLDRAYLAAKGAVVGLPPNRLVELKSFLRLAPTDVLLVILKRPDGGIERHKL